MGQAKANPFSAQFDIARLSGEMPSVAIEGGVLVEIVPSIEWLDQNPPDAEGNRPNCPPHRADVRWSLALAAIFPSRLLPPVRWTKGQAPCAELHRMPFREGMVHLQAHHPELADQIRGVLAQGIEDAEAATQLAADEPKLIEGA